VKGGLAKGYPLRVRRSVLSKRSLFQNRACFTREGGILRRWCGPWDARAIPVWEGGIKRSRRPLMHRSCPSAEEGIRMASWGLLWAVDAVFSCAV
jgi:hypothetical protein